MKRNGLAIVVVALVLVMSATFIAVAPVAANANAELPFTLTAPSNVVLTKENIGDSDTTLGMAYSMSNEMNAFFCAYHDSGDGAAYLNSLGITAYDEINIGVQIDWALDDVNDEVSGWHHNAYWDAAPLGTFGQDEDGKFHYSEWDVPHVWIYATQTVNDIWLYRFMNMDEWLGGENRVGVKDQLRPSQYTYRDNDGDPEIRINWAEHTMYSRVRFVITTYNSENNITEYTFSDWSSVVAWGKDAEKMEPLKPEDISAPVITGLRMTDEIFNDNPVVAFTLTVPEDVMEAATRATAKNDTLRIEVEARRKGTTEWKDLHVASDITTGEHKADLVYLVEEGQTFPAGTEIEMRARYLCMQSGQDDFYSAYSKIIGFGSDEIKDTSTPVVDDKGNNEGEAGAVGSITDTHKCKICHICPEPLGLCIFIWIVIIVVVLGVAAAVCFILKKKKDAQKTNKNK
jgi:hypothetical protein